MLPALSVRQPWAELILCGRKQIEVRSWSTRYRGFLWLHTGRVPEVDAARRFGLGELFVGGFVGIIELTEIIPFDSERWERWRSLHLSAGLPQIGLFAWMISNPVRLKTPIPAPGQRGLFEISPKLFERNLASLSVTPSLS